MFGFWKSLVLVSLFFVLAPVTLGLSMFSLFALNNSNTATQVVTEKPIATNLIENPKSGVSVYASFPSYQPSISDSIEQADARVEIIKQYLRRYNSPLLPHASVLVETADKYELDFRLLAAIAQQESNLCKIIPPGSHNCWGWGIHSAGSLGFDSYEEGIETVSRGLRKNYFDKGRTTVEDIMAMYTPQSNGSWARGVNIFMADMQ